MAKAATPLDEVDQCVRDRTDRKHVATDLSMLDGYVTAIVAGPLSFAPREWVYPLLAADLNLGAALDTDGGNHLLLLPIFGRYVDSQRRRPVRADQEATARHSCAKRTWTLRAVIAAMRRN
jgi:hypothetical protein